MALPCGPVVRLVDFVLLSAAIVHDLGKTREFTYGAEISRRMQPWMTFAERLAERIIAGSPLAGFVDPAVIGSAVVALYMGLEIVARMRGGDSGGSSALMTTLVQAAPWIDQLLGKAPRGRRRPTASVAIE